MRSFEISKQGGFKCFFLAKHAMSKYKQLLLKMAQDFTLATSIENVVAKMNLNLILNVQLIMTLLCLLPLLEIVHVLIKFNQT
jgi:type IV secretory pathway component VirB8